MFRFFVPVLILLSPITGFGQGNEWETQYVTFDDGSNGTGNRTPSVAVIGPNRFVGLVTRFSGEATPDNMFNPHTNYLVGYWDADSALGRVPSPINGSQGFPIYGEPGSFSDWEYLLEKVTLQGAWQIAADTNGYIYVANNDNAHNILVFELTANGLVSTPYRMETGPEYIFAIDVDDSGYVYVADYMGSNTKTNEVKIYAGIQAEGTTWGVIGAHNDPPVTTIDLPPGIYQGLTVSGDGRSVFISVTSERSIWKFVGSPSSGYSRDTSFSFVLSADDTVGNGGHGTPSVLGLGYLNDPPVLFAAVDTFLSSGISGGYPYGRIYAIDPSTGMPLDTIDIAAWNFAMTGFYDTGSNNGRVGGFTSVYDVDVEETEKAIYSQTYYGWAVEKWVFSGDLNVLNIEQISAQLPNAFQLKQNYPNPFNPITTIEFSIMNSDPVRLDVYNIMGQKVATLLHRRLSPGVYKIVFDATGLPSGVYFYQLIAGEQRQVRKMILSK